MSKRYGRNQRRHHREEIARLEREAVSINFSAARDRNERARILDLFRDLDDRIRRVLGPNSAFRLKLSETTVSHIDRFFRLPDMSPMSVFTPMRDDEMPTMETFSVINLVHFLTYVEADDGPDLQGLRRLVAIMVKQEHGGRLADWRYAVSEEQWHAAGFDRQARRYLFEHIVKSAAEGEERARMKRRAEAIARGTFR